MLTPFEKDDHVLLHMLQLGANDHLKYALGDELSLVFMQVSNPLVSCMTETLAFVFHLVVP
jgi:hypothetical protein